MPRRSNWVIVAGVIAVAIAWRPLTAAAHGPGDIGAVTVPVFACLAGPVIVTCLVVRGLVATARRRADERRSSRQWRLDHHVCLECGYDVRATPDQCPECGARQEKWWA